VAAYGGPFPSGRGPGASDIRSDLHTLAEVQGEPVDDAHRRRVRRSEMVRWRSYDAPRERLLEAVISVADADSEDDGTALHRGWCRLRKTLIDLGWTPPARRPGDAAF
jgi:hypothetical protein